MSTKTKALIAILLVVGVASFAYASTSTEALLPLVVNEVDKRPTATPTATPIPDVKINYIEEGDYWDEFVRVKNRTTGKVDLEGWTIKSKWSGKVFTFPEFTLKSNKAVKVWTRPGTDSDTDIFWGISSDWWHDSEDCAKLVDDNGKFVQWYIYPEGECEW